ncbi:uncharacterized protein KD926_002462 [Aspergillus affinis]|uniref:uncharacterized protein n=1 Tax=Aspergillus affinis TaxID=1070780 RepID=UPI0022FE29B3|nr:uncharacterized protein KD926_002462 [Aspergillus affinis]KAI9036085.1 hypothetical protein KD926_002462 [Aspergillus affinis]
MVHVEKAQKKAGQNSVFRHVLSSDMPESECGTEQLAREALQLFGAGTATLVRAFSMIFYYVLSNPQMRDRLREELKEIMAEYPAKRPTWQELERLPYLHGTVKEGLRLSYEIMHYLARVSPDQAL